MAVTNHTLSIADQEITKIVVLTDRAEIRRCVKLTVQSGINEIQLKNITADLLPDSLRVEGKGKAIIHDVTTKTEPALEIEVDSDKQNALKSVLEKERETLQEFRDKSQGIQSRINALDKVLASAGSSTETQSSFGIGTKAIQDFATFLEFHEKKEDELRTKKREVTIQIKKAEKRVQKAEDAIKGLIKPRKSDYLKYANIILEVEEETKVELNIVYQVRNASWLPSYDIRVDTSTSSMEIIYVGKIQQFTSEDWQNAPIVLSTAQPSRGGKLPEIGTLEARFYPRPTVVHQQTHSYGGGGALFGISHSQVQLQQNTAPQGALFGAPITHREQRTIEEPMEIAVASEVTQTILSTEFTIARRATIPAGTPDHKVTIGRLNMTPKLEYQSVPSKNAAVFLIATVVNESDLAFLAGPAAIFLDNAFVAKTELKNTAPGERFTLSLGLDTGIKVEYKPKKTYHAEGGFLSKHAANVTEHVILVKNTRKDRQTLVTVIHHVPRSTGEMMKITLKSPEATPYDPNAMITEDEEVKEGAKMNSNNNLEWTVKLGGGESKELVIKWLVEHPIEDKIRYIERF